MEIIILTDGLYYLKNITESMIEGLVLIKNHGLTCFDLCDVLRLKLTTYADYPINAHVMNDGSGDFYGCICR
jgi:hypothetical protein